MERHLYFICPTDHLEPVINNTYQRENYFLTSLGNSLTFDIEMTLWLSEFLRTKNIRNITFVLSEDNCVIRDRSGDNTLTDISAINALNEKLVQHRKDMKKAWKTYDQRLMTLSYHLNDKIRELQQKLHLLSVRHIRITGKIFRRDKTIFRNTYSGLICSEHACVN